MHARRAHARLFGVRAAVLLLRPAVLGRRHRGSPREAGRPLAAMTMVVGRLPTCRVGPESERSRFNPVQALRLRGCRQ